VSDYHDWTRGFHAEALKHNPEQHPHDRMRDSAIAWREREAVVLPVAGLHTNPGFSSLIALGVAGAAVTLLAAAGGWGKGASFFDAIGTEFGNLTGNIHGTLNGNAAPTDSQIIAAIYAKFGLSPTAGGLTLESQTVWLYNNHPWRPASQYPDAPVGNLNLQQLLHNNGGTTLHDAVAFLQTFAPVVTAPNAK
jgi:hypothetical protein